MSIPEHYIPDEFKNFVTEVEDPVTNDQINLYGKVQEITDKSFRLRTIVAAWKDQNSEERTMRQKFAKAILIALFLQILVINVAFFLIGFNVIIIPQWVATTFIISVFSEIISMTMLVLRYLFPKVGGEVIELIKNL